MLGVVSGAKVRICFQLAKFSGDFIFPVFGKLLIDRYYMGIKSM